MTATLFNRYIWLVETIYSAGHISMEEINRRWANSQYNELREKELPLRTFHRHKEAIKAIFDIEIKCDRRIGNLYYIANTEDLEEESMRRWLISTFSVNSLLSESRALKLELENKLRPTEIIGNSSNMKKVYMMISKVAASNATVLIRGESGTGKELVAKAIQRNSLRRDNPFIVVNCAALPEGLIESELFGHEKGSFTGAVNRKIGLAELADKGTLFLDEIGDLSLPMQLKLLRFIQEHTFYRVGGNEERKVDVRIIAATSRNLEEMIHSGSFREDLYYRLNVFPIYMPALRNRKSDIVLLAEYFLRKYTAIHSKQIVRISTPAINMMNGRIV